MLAPRKIIVSVVSAAALVCVGPAAAFSWCPGFPVRLLKTGPVPATVTITSGDGVNWWETGLFGTTQVTFADIPCSFRFTGNGTAGTSVTGCSFFLPGTYPYSVQGVGAGTGTIVVLPPPLLAAPTPVVFGDPTVVSGEVPSRPDCTGGGGIGTVPPPTPEQEATILTRPYGEAELRSFTTVTAVGPRGDFALWVTPTISTTYQARLGALETVTATVEVRPRIELHRLVDRSFVVHAEAARSLAGAEVQEQVRKGPSPWRSVTTLQLDDTGSARFDEQRGPSRVRIFMSAQEAGPGYVSGFSRTVTL